MWCVFFWRHCASLFKTHRLSAVDHRVFFEDFLIAKYNTLYDTFDVFVRPDSEENSLRSSTSLRSQVSAAVHRWSEHVMNAICVEYECWVGNIVFAGRLWQWKSFLEHAENRLRHGFRSPRLQGASFTETHVLDEILTVPAFLPHRLELILITFSCRKKRKRRWDIWGFIHTKCCWFL